MVEKPIRQWRAADAGRRARADEPAGAAARRALAGPGAQGDRGVVYRAGHPAQRRADRAAGGPDGALALSLADRAYVLASGRVVAEGTAQSLLADESLLSAYLGEAAA